MAGLLGSSSSPISGFGILSTMLIAVALGFSFSGTSDAQNRAFVVALTLFITSMIVTTASIANDNLQDLKTGHMIGATPWKQQAALAIGVIIGAITVAPVLGLLYHAYGFVGSLPRPGMNPQDAMLAPQATLMTQIANGIVRHELAWNMVFIGAALGAALVATEALLRRNGFSLPALTVGLGVYLPSTVVVTIAVGGVIGWLAERAMARGAKRTGKALKDEDEAKVRRRGVLIASGFLVGESLIGIFIAAVDALKGKSGSLAVIGVQSHFSIAIGLLAFTATLIMFFRATSRLQSCSTKRR
jgi:putative OPT family oligopeptide transporter